MAERSGSDTRHLLYIIANARYKCEFDDAEEFNKALNVFKKLPSLSPLGLQGETYKQDYISGMYPELEEAVKYFRNKVYPDPNNKKVLPDAVLKKYADETIQKFGLKDSYDFNKEPDAEQLARLNTRIMPKQIKDMNNLAPELLKKMGIALSDISKDFRAVHKFMECFSYAEDVVSGRISKERAQEFTQFKGVKLGLSLLELVDQGIIDKDLKILDAPRLRQSPIIREFTIAGKSYDLSQAFQDKSEMPPLVRREAGMMPKYREFCKKVKNNVIVKTLRKTRLNPYHTFLPEIKADSYEEAKEKAYDEGKVQFLYKGTRYYSERHDCSATEEYNKYHKLLRGRGDVSDRVPRNAKGEVDLFAEDPIIIAVMPIEGPALYGHVSMQYKDRVINRLISTIYTDPIYDTYKDYTEYYAIYPSKLGLDPKQIIREIDKHNIRYGYKKFNLGFNNCSKNIIKVLEKLGIKDINLLGPDKLGLRMPTPGNNPFGFGLKDWCFRNGVHVYPEEVAQMTARYPVTDNEQRRDEQEAIRERYKAITKAKVRTRKEAEAEKAAKQTKPAKTNKRAPTSGPTGPVGGKKPFDGTER